MISLQEKNFTVYTLFITKYFMIHWILNQSAIKFSNISTAISNDAVCSILGNS